MKFMKTIFIGFESYINMEEAYSRKKSVFTFQEGESQTHFCQNIKNK